ncbi:hypothetical protein V1504DRAFT_453401 [Lipomyces starkeyi]
MAWHTKRDSLDENRPLLTRYNRGCTSSILIPEIPASELSSALKIYTTYHHHSFLRLNLSCVRSTTGKVGDLHHALVGPSRSNICPASTKGGTRKRKDNDVNFAIEKKVLTNQLH